MSKQRSTLRNQAEFAVYRLARGLTGFLSPSALARFGDVVGDLYSLTGGRRQRIIDFNLALAFPEKTETERRQLARQVTRHFARLAFDAMRIQRLRPDELLAAVDISGWEHVERAAALGRGVIFLTAHIGSWEVAALVVGLKVDGGLSVVNRPLDNPLLEVEVDRLRRLYGNRVFGKRNIVREMLRELKSNRAVGILIDQRVPEGQGIEVPFFGHPARTHPILARLCRKTGAPVVPLFVFCDAPGRYSLHIDEPVVVDVVDDVEKEDVPMTARFMAIIENAIRARPDQWLWYHDRWKQLRVGNSEFGIRN
jgi:KDO2-lipid IV(A) lauroyltransferase